MFDNITYLCIVRIVSSNIKLNILDVFDRFATSYIPLRIFQPKGETIHAGIHAGFRNAAISRVSFLEFFA